MARITIDLTEAPELRTDPIEVDVPGLGVFDFPPTIPTQIITTVSRLGRDGRTELTGDEVLELLAGLVPENVLRQWSSLGFDPFAERNVPIVEKILDAVLSEYQRADRREVSNLSVVPTATEASEPPPWTGEVEPVVEPEPAPPAPAPTRPPFPVG